MIVIRDFTLWFVVAVVLGGTPTGCGWFEDFKDKGDVIVRNDVGIIVEKPYLWKTPLTEPGNVTKLGLVKTPLIYSDYKVVCGGMFDEKNCLMAINPFDGSVEWKWFDLMTLLTDPTYPDPIRISFNTYHQQGNTLFFTHSTSSYCLDLESGTTVWKHKIPRGRYGENGGVDNIYFTSGREDYYSTSLHDNEKLYYGYLDSSAEEQFLLEPDYYTVEKPLMHGNFSSVLGFKHEGDIYVAYTIVHPAEFYGNNENPTLCTINLYNFTKRSHVYQNIAINPDLDTRFGNAMKYQPPYMYLSTSRYMYCFNMMSGKRVWRTYIGGSSLSATMLLANDKLYVNTEELLKLFCVDAFTGYILWKSYSPGTCTEITELNGVIYFIGGGDGLLHALDGETGKQYWWLRSPDKAVDSGPNGSFSLHVVAVPGKNGNKDVILAETPRNAYGYEPVR